MKKIYVFSGITLSRSEIEKLSSALEPKPPAKCGDILTAIKEGVSLIILIDGSFDWTRAIWHKEILFAISQGVNVIGASSMGALRAAELNQYGMLGFGEIYNRYQLGLIERDDEVATFYIKEKNQFTLPLINIRLSIEPFNQEVFQRIIFKAEQLFYKQRSWSNLAKLLNSSDLSLLKEHYKDFKKLEAIACIKNLNRFSWPKQRLDFESTIYFKQLQGTSIANIQSEVNLTAQSNTRAKNLMKLLSIPSSEDIINQIVNLIHHIDQQRFNPTDELKHHYFKKLRRDLELYSSDQLRRWAQKKHFSQQSLDSTISDYAMLKKLNYPIQCKDVKHEERSTN